MTWARSIVMGVHLSSGSAGSTAFCHPCCCAITCTTVATASGGGTGASQGLSCSGRQRGGEVVEDVLIVFTPCFYPS